MSLICCALLSPVSMQSAPPLLAPGGAKPPPQAGRWLLPAPRGASLWVHTAGGAPAGCGEGAAALGRPHSTGRAGHQQGTGREGGCCSEPGLRGAGLRWEASRRPNLAALVLCRPDTRSEAQQKLPGGPHDAAAGLGQGFGVCGGGMSLGPGLGLGPGPPAAALPAPRLRVSFGHGCFTGGAWASFTVLGGPHESSADARPNPS